MNEKIINDESGDVVRVIADGPRLRFLVARQYENRHTEFRLSGESVAALTEFLVDSLPEQPQKRRGPGRPRKTEAA
jgi:hypothetical protein